MLWFERQLVRGLVAGPDQEQRSAVEAYVDGTLRVMPEHLRAGVAAGSVVLGGWAKVRGGRLDVEALDRSRIGPVRQYVRLFRSLVLFAEQEMTPADLPAT